MLSECPKQPGQRKETGVRAGSKLFYSYIIFLAIYTGFALIPAPLPATLALYDVSATGLRLIYVTIILLLAVIWFAGFYGYAKLNDYNKMIDGNKDGHEVDKLTKGLFLIVMWLPVSQVISIVTNYFALRHPGWLPTVTVINNYIGLIIPLVGFVYIGMGARGLSTMVKHRPSYPATNVLAILIIYIGLIYLRLVATTQNRDMVYHMSMWLIILTLAAPYVYMWAVGLVAAYEIYLYHQKVAGVVYKKSWSLLAAGLGWLIVMSVVVQYLTTLNARLAHLSIYWLLVIIYSLLLVMSVGFILVALGARKLQKIEEV
jgi:hypothetical protein